MTDCIYETSYLRTKWLDDPEQEIQKITLCIIYIYEYSLLLYIMKFNYPFF